MDSSHLTIENNKFIELIISFDMEEDEWWLEEDDFDEDKEYDEDNYPMRWCVFCRNWQHIDDPNVLKLAVVVTFL